WFWGKIYLRGRSRGRLLQEELLGYIDGSWQVLIDAMERAILEKGGRVLTSTRVRRIQTSQGRVIGLEAQSPDGQITEQKLDAIIATIASPFIAQLSPDLPQEYRNRLTNTQYQAIVCVTLILKRALSDIYWTNISDPTMPFVGAIEQTNFIPPETYGGRHILYLSNYVAQGSRLTKLSPEEILAEYLPSLRRINPAFREDWMEEYRFFRDFAGQPVIGTNYSQRLLPHRTPLPGLYLANMTQIYPEDRGTNYSARLGKQVAKVIWEDVQTGALSQAGGLVGEPT
ncbi:MAG: FAD-dependent oxidoreductase, partial [Chloroflexi bacterium]|nr:FAD-dependent oxidoreductase [Chloroflexota bacterium]